MIEGILLSGMLSLLLACIIAGVPVFYVLLAVPLLTALAGMVFGVFDAALLWAIPSRMFGVFSNQVLFAVPLFVLMGKLLEHSGLAQEMLTAFAKGRGRVAQRFPFIVLCLCLLVAASTGVVGATITMLASIALPTLLASGYGTRRSAGLICAGGSLGQIIPPSIVLILLSDQVSNASIAVQRAGGDFSPEPVTVGHLFAGALMPGLVLFICYLIYLVIQKPETTKVTTPVSEEMASDGPSLAPVLVFAILLLVPFAIVGGFATPSEAGGIGAFACLVACLTRGMGRVVKTALRETMELTGVIFAIIVAASVFALVFRGLDGDALIGRMLAGMPDATFWALILVLALVFVLGFFLEFVEITYIVIPIAAPILFSLGVDPVWFAILVAVNLQVSFLTPPMGIALFYYKSVAAIDTVELYRAIVPYVLIQLAVLMLVFMVPALATWLPSAVI